jgi:hypothetical protein
MSTIPGYTHGSSQVAPSPVSLRDFELMKKTALLGDDDLKALKQSYEILKDQTEAVLDVWYGFIGSNPHLVKFFMNKQGQPDTHYLEAVRKRFGQWILDTASANYDQKWLDYQHEIGLRHHHEKKNKTDNATASDTVVSFRYLLPIIFPVVFTLKPFLAKKGNSTEDVERMHQAWLKSVLLQITLWCHPFIKPGDF